MNLSTDRFLSTLIFLTLVAFCISLDIYLEWGAPCDTFSDQNLLTVPPRCVQLKK